MQLPHVRLCACGSGLPKRPLTDGHGIFMTYVCDKCHDEKVSHFREDIFTCYECDEPIDEE